MKTRRVETGPPRWSALCLVLVSLSLAGCYRGCASSSPPIHPNPNMDDQPKYEPFEASDFFYDGAAMRTPVPGTVARGESWKGDAFNTGRDESGAFLVTMPVEQNDSTLARGGGRYGIYCSPCHDQRGNGTGILANRGGIPTPSFHEQRIRDLPDGELFDVITHGLGLMPAYGYPIRAHDRWSIIAHLRRLQRERELSEVALASGN